MVPTRDLADTCSGQTHPLGAGPEDLGIDVSNLSPRRRLEPT